MTEKLKKLAFLTIIELNITLKRDELSLFLTSRTVYMNILYLVGKGKIR